MLHVASSSGSPIFSTLKRSGSLGTRLCYMYTVISYTNCVFNLDTISLEKLKICQFQCSTQAKSKKEVDSPHSTYLY